MATDEPNGTLRWRVEQIEKREATHEEAARWLSRMGERHNEQIKDHGRRLTNLEEDVGDLPAVRAEIRSLKDSFAAARTAGWAVVVALVGLAGTIVWQGPS